MCITVKIYSLILIFLAITRAASLPPANCTLPVSSQLHFDEQCKTLCRSATWTDLVLFYLGNYVAHVATIKMRPGLPAHFCMIARLLALLLPNTGALRSIDAIRSRAVFADTELRTAARAGALFEVKMRPGESLLREREAANPVTRLLAHGRVCLPECCDLEEVDPRTEFENDPPEAGSMLQRFEHKFWPTDPNGQRVHLASSYSVSKAIVSILQVSYAVATLYRARGTQINRFGYAAFGLTVTPYAYISVLNLLAGLMCPEYPKIYIVESPVLDRLRERIVAEGRRAEFFVESTVGRIAKPVDKAARLDHAVGQEKGPWSVLMAWIAMFWLSVGADFKRARALRSQFAIAIRPRRPRSQSSGQDAHSLNESSIALPEISGASENGTRNAMSGSLQGKEAIQSKPRIRMVLRQLYVLAYVVSFILVVLLNFALLMASLGLPAIIIAVLSGSRLAYSTLAQRAWTMSWLATGIIVGVDFGAYFRLIQRLTETPFVDNCGLGTAAILTWFLLALAYFVPAIGGFIVVGQMIMQCGTCINVT